jgi:hypothetical protein
MRTPLDPILFGMFVARPCEALMRFDISNLIQVNKDNKAKKAGQTHQSGRKS